MTEPVNIPLDDDGNPLPFQSIADLLARNGLPEELAPTEGMNEAAGIVWADARFVREETGELSLIVGKISITARATNSVDAFQNLLVTLAKAEKMGICVTLEDAPRQAPPRTASTGGEAVQPTQPGRNVVPAMRQGSQSGSGKTTSVADDNGDGTFSTHIEKVGVAPQADGTVRLEFYEKNSWKYPHQAKTFAISKADAIALLMGAGYEVDGSHVTVTKNTVYEDMPCILVWKNSTKTNAKGAPYKNFVRLEPDLSA